MKATLFTKLTSRKFWIGLILVVVGIVMCITGDVEHGLVIAGLGAGTYLGCETITDVVGIVFKNKTETETEEENKEE